MTMYVSTYSSFPLEELGYENKYACFNLFFINGREPLTHMNKVAKYVMIMHISKFLTVIQTSRSNPSANSIIKKDGN